jgi:predicted ferric reductase
MDFLLLYEFQIVRWLGRLNIILAVIAVSLYGFRRINKYLVFLMMPVALFGKKYKLKNWLKFHRALAVLFVIAILVHIFARNIF